VANYRAYLIGDDGHFWEAISMLCADDADAMKRAQCLANRHNVELWEGDRKVGTFEPRRQKSGRSITHEIHDGRMISKPTN
jgi:hypothetical protein